MVWQIFQKAVPYKGHSALILRLVAERASPPPARCGDPPVSERRSSSSSRSAAGGVERAALRHAHSRHRRRLKSPRAS
eukprot:365866-Chlamydomonas_euryale.AAC.9